MTTSHQCSYCHQQFKTEGGFLRHKCKSMVREEEFASSLGQAAWMVYKTWMKKKHRSVVSSADAFKKSKYFTTFYNFMKFVKKTQVPDVNVYVDLMVSKAVDPIYWGNAGAYRKYLEYVSRQLPTRDLAKITIKTLFDIADAADVDVSEVFDVLTPNEVIQLLHQRRLSPWILLNSKKFAVFFLKQTNPEEKIVMETIVNPDYWSKRFEKNTKDVVVVRQYIAELGL